MTIEKALRTALVEAPRGRISFPRDFHGFPGTVHGGAVAALFYRLTLPQPPVHLRMDLLRSVPTDTPLRLTTGSSRHEARLALAQDDRRLAEATLSRERVPEIDAGLVRTIWVRRRDPQGEVPGTSTCLACGSRNPLGLGVRFLFNDHLLWREYTPREGHRATDGSAHPALATIMLDELGWWLGALSQAECGVTTQVTITLYRRLPFEPLLVVGDRDTVRPDADPRGRYCHASGYLFTADGELLAAAEVRFAGSRAYTRRLLQPFLETTDLETLTRLFPSAGRSEGWRGGPAPGLTERF